MLRGTPLKVGHIAQGLDMGGLERMLLDFAKFTNSGRFETAFFSLTSRGVMAEILEDLGRPVRILGKPPGLRLGAISNLARMLRAERVDIVHTHNNSALLYGAAAARLAGIRRVIHTRHGYEPENRRLEATLRVIAHSVDKIVAVSADTQAVAVAAGLPERKLKTITNGIDLERFPRRPLQVDGPIVTVARLSPQKDVATLLQALAIARTGGVVIPAEIIGDGPLRSDLERLAAELGIAGTTTFRGELKNVSEVLSRARLFVLPAINEGLPLTLLEAMATGLPVIATAVGGNCEVVVDGVTGLLVPARDPAQLAAALTELIPDASRLLAMADAGRKRAETNYDVRRTINAYERLYAGDLS